MGYGRTGLTGTLLTLALVGCGSSDLSAPPPSDDGGAWLDGDAATDAGGDEVTGDAPSACSSPQTQCDTRCVDLTSDPNDCGACDRVCPTGPHASPSCTGSACGLVCDPGWSDCNRNPADGCEAQLDDDPQNCGVCGRECTPLPSAYVTCTNGTCGIGACLTGFADCNMFAGDGCEADLGVDPANCGSCGTACPSGSACSGGTCKCTNGDTLCGSTCTDTLSDTHNCGTCGNACAAAQTCNLGSCTCTYYYPDLCGNTCVNVQNDVNNCGTCGHVCPSGELCQSGVCGCNSGYTFCNGTCAYTSNDTNNCGSCGNACATGQICNAGSCACPRNASTLCNGICSDAQNDPRNCGTCGNACTGATPTCTAGTCVVAPVTLAYGLMSPGAIALDANYVYWVDDSYGGMVSGSVMRVPKAGGGVTTLAQNLNGPDSLAVDATGVYLTVPGSSQVEKVPLVGGTPTVLATQAAYGLALSGTTLFVGGGDLEAIPTTGGSLTLLATGQNEPRAIATDSKNVYWITTGGVVSSIPFGGGAPTTLTSGQGGYSGIAVDATNVYWTNSYAGTIVSVPITGGGLTTLATGQSDPASIAVAGGYVYWTNNAIPGSVMKVPVGGGTPSALATGQIAPLGLAVDDTYVYWTTNEGNSNGAVMRTTR